MKKNTCREKCQRPFPLRYSRRLVSLVQKFCLDRPKRRPGTRGFWQEFTAWLNSTEANSQIGALGRRHTADHRTWSCRYSVAKHFLSPEGRRQQVKLNALFNHLTAAGGARGEFCQILSQYSGVREAAIRRCLQNRIRWPKELEDAIVELTGLDLKQYNKKSAPLPDPKIPDEDDQLPPAAAPEAIQTNVEVVVDIVRRLSAGGKVVTSKQAQVIGDLINGKTLIDIVVEQM